MHLFGLYLGLTDTLMVMIPATILAAIITCILFYYLFHGVKHLHLEVKGGLLEAVRSANLADVDYLVRWQANMQQVDFRGNNALMIAVDYGGNDDVARYLIRHSTPAHLHHQNNSGETALTLAIKRLEVILETYRKKMRELIDKNDRGETTPILAIENFERIHKADSDKIRTLITELIKRENDNNYRKKAINSIREKGDLTFALRLAAQYDFVDIVRELLAVEGLNINEGDAAGNSALRLAKPDGTIATLLVSAGARFRVHDPIMTY